MRKWLNNYFDFTKSEFNGLLVLLVLIGLVTAAPYAYALIKKKDYHPEDDLIVKRLILKNSESISSPVGITKSYKAKSINRSYNKHKLSYFDPNVVGQDEWMRMGLSQKQAAAILKYVEKGGRFRKTEDLKKMYTISPEKYQEISGYVKITPAEVSSTKDKKALPSIVAKPYPSNNSAEVSSKTLKYPVKPAVMVELNGADSAKLDDIRGIGPAFALRILTYRERIGGFVNKEQLLEVFGLDSLKYAEIKNQVRVDPVSVRKININTATVEQYKNHPYLRFKQINAIIQYRKQHGNYSNIADLAKVVVIPAETIARLAPYLTF
jgi:competence protein ComEA